MAVQFSPLSNNERVVFDLFLTTPLRSLNVFQLSNISQVSKGWYQTILKFAAFKENLLFDNTIDRAACLKLNDEYILGFFQKIKQIQIPIGANLRDIKLISLRKIILLFVQVHQLPDTELNKLVKEFDNNFSGCLVERILRRAVTNTDLERQILHNLNSGEKVTISPTLKKILVLAFATGKFSLVNSIKKLECIKKEDIDSSRNNFRLYSRLNNPLIPTVDTRLMIEDIFEPLIDNWLADKIQDERIIEIASLVDNRDLLDQFILRKCEIFMSQENYQIVEKLLKLVTSTDKYCEFLTRVRLKQFQANEIPFIQLSFFALQMNIRQKSSLEVLKEITVELLSQNLTHEATNFIDQINLSFRDEFKLYLADYYFKLNNEEEAEIIAKKCASDGQRYIYSILAKRNLYIGRTIEALEYFINIPRHVEDSFPMSQLSNLEYIIFIQLIEQNLFQHAKFLLNNLVGVGSKKFLLNLYLKKLKGTGIY